MTRRKHPTEGIISKLREAQVVIAAGSTVAEAARRIAVSEQTFTGNQLRGSCQAVWQSSLILIVQT